MQQPPWQAKWAIAADTQWSSLSPNSLLFLSLWWGFSWCISASSVIVMLKGTTISLVSIAGSLMLSLGRYLPTELASEWLWRGQCWKTMLCLSFCPLQSSFLQSPRPRLSYHHLITSFSNSCTSQFWQVWSGCPFASISTSLQYAVRAHHHDCPTQQGPQYLFQDTCKCEVQYQNITISLRLFTTCLPRQSLGTWGSKRLKHLTLSFEATPVIITTFVLACGQ